MQYKFRTGMSVGYFPEPNNFSSTSYAKRLKSVLYREEILDSTVGLKALAIDPVTFSGDNTRLVKVVIVHDLPENEIFSAMDWPWYRPDFLPISIKS